MKWYSLFYIVLTKKVSSAFVVNPNLSIISSSQRNQCHSYESSTIYSLKRKDTKLKVLMDSPSAYQNSPEKEQNLASTYSEYVSLQPGSLLRIRIGDLSASRKAWKKRRRSGSPLLIPCSVLGMNRIDSIRCNLMHLMQKYGRNLEEKYGGGKGGTNGLALKVKNVVTLWEREYGASLLYHAEQLGYDGVGDLLLSIYGSDELSSSANKKSTSTIQNQGIYVLKTDSNLILYHPTMSLRRGRTNASNTSLLQMSSQVSLDSEIEVQHTGFIRPSSEEDELLPLGAALRVVNNNALSRISENQVVSAFVLQYDPSGDNDSPLLMVTLDPPRSQLLSAKGNKKLNVQNNLRAKKLETMNTKVKHMFDELSVGDGPYHGKVIAINRNYGAAFVDIGVGRKRGTNRGGGIEKVIGMLRFEDMNNVEDSKVDETYETVEDISDLYQVGDDGVTLYSIDPETGEKSEIGSTEGDVDDDDDDDDDDDMFAGMDAEERLRAIEEMLGDEIPSQSKTSSKGIITDDTIKPGDDVDVFIRSIFPQSRRFMVSTNKPSSSTKNKDRKHKKVADKRMSKLSKGDALQNMKKYTGKECLGVVKAVSKTGNWFYVAPELEEDTNLPQVGVAHPLEDSDASYSDIVVGTRVKIRLEGLDEKRGQLSMSLLSKEE